MGHLATKLAQVGCKLLCCVFGWHDYREVDASSLRKVIAITLQSPKCITIIVIREVASHEHNASERSSMPEVSGIQSDATKETAFGVDTRRT